MTKINHFKLVEGKFNIQDTTMLILSFFNTKIIFHNQQLLQTLELGLNNDGLIEQRINELQQTKIALLELINSQKNNDILFDIEGYINIKI